MIEKFVLDCKQIRLLLPYEFKKQSSARVAEDYICGTVGPTTVSYDTAEVWFLEFNSGDVCLEEQPRSGRSVAVNEERLLELVQEDPRRGTRKLAEELECSHTTMAKHLRGVGKTYRYSALIPNQLSGHQLQVRQDACTNFLTLRRSFSWLENDGNGYLTLTTRESVCSSVAAKQEFPRRDRNTTQKKG
ncbi:unnamed protein product [Heligmosomoides polygyrus]|uniref:HTH_48 domain-containing protein n=1 Tax=Heligmosomoides polygyrus TaxID=6339 RepID=A0A183GEE8_HELPZ|nr:unnamed protein product [Heligmosomoides polygyrus]